jgi:hypothetical protein
MVSSIAANTADCVDCRVDTDPSVRPTTGNSRELASLTTEIDRRATHLGCTAITTNRNFEVIQIGLNRAGTSPEEFFSYAKCENNWGTENNELPEITPYQLALIDPSSRLQMLLELFEYFDNNVEDKSILRAILNHRDERGRTMLDFLEFLYENKYKNDHDSRAYLDRLRNEMCRRGGRHSEPQENCTANKQYTIEV